MACKHKVVSVTGTPQNLATALGLSGVTATYCVYFSIQALAANVGIVFIGGASTTLTAASAYAFRIEIPVSTVPSAPWFRESSSLVGVLNLGDWQFVGTGGDSIAVAWELYPS